MHRSREGLHESRERLHGPWVGLHEGGERLAEGRNSSMGDGERVPEEEERANLEASRPKRSWTGIFWGNEA